MRRHALAAAIGLVVVAAGVTACGLILGVDEPHGTALPPVPPEAAAPPDPCSHVGAPSQPAAEDPGESVPPFWLALRKSYIGQTVSQPDAGVAGFDLDGTCTCNKSGLTVHDGGSSCTPREKGTPTCDYDGGVDNSIEQLFSSFAGVFDGNKFIERVTAGSKDVIIYIADYNGQKNDLSVTAGFAIADGIYTDDCDPSLQVNSDPAGTQNHAGGVFTASWRGCDKWHGLQTGFIGSPTVPQSNVPKALGRGFVRDGMLILTGLTEVPVFFGDSQASVQDPTLVAPLEAVPTLNAGDPQRFKMTNAVLAGRLPLSDVAGIAFNSTYNGFYTCQNTTTFQALMSSLCSGVDLADSKSLDFQGLVCSSMSFAFRFDADLVDVDRAVRTPDSDDSPNPCRSLPVPPIDTLCPATSDAGP